MKIRELQKRLTSVRYAGGDSIRTELKRVLWELGGSRGEQEYTGAEEDWDRLTRCMEQLASAGREEYRGHSAGKEYDDYGYVSREYTLEDDYNEGVRDELQANILSLAEEMAHKAGIEEYLKDAGSQALLMSDIIVRARNAWDGLPESVSRAPDGSPELATAVNSAKFMLKTLSDEIVRVGIAGHDNTQELTYRIERICREASTEDAHGIRTEIDLFVANCVRMEYTDRTAIADITRDILAGYNMRADDKEQAGKDLDEARKKISRLADIARTGWLDAGHPSKRLSDSNIYRLECLMDVTNTHSIDGFHIMGERAIRMLARTDSEIEGIRKSTLADIQEAAGRALNAEAGSPERLVQAGRLADMLEAQCEIVGDRALALKDRLNSSIIAAQGYMPQKLEGYGNGLQDDLKECLDYAERELAINALRNIYNSHDDVDTETIRTALKAASEQAEHEFDQLPDTIRKLRENAGVPFVPDNTAERSEELLHIMESREAETAAEEYLLQCLSDMAHAEDTVSFYISSGKALMTLEHPDSFIEKGTEVSLQDIISTAEEAILADEDEMYELAGKLDNMLGPVKETHKNLGGTPTEMMRDLLENSLYNPDYGVPLMAAVKNCRNAALKETERLKETEKTQPDRKAEKLEKALTKWTDSVQKTELPSIQDIPADYRQLLLDALRVVPIEEGSFNPDDESIVKAMTVNENLKGLGYCLNPGDVLRLAASPSLDTFYDSVAELLPTDMINNAKVFYPDFPKQVMAMTEAQLLFTQMVSYMAYDLKHCGIDVGDAWRPKGTEKTEPDEMLLKAKTLGLVDTDDIYHGPMKTILAKRERMTEMEGKIVAEAVRHVPARELGDISVTFKENMTDVYTSTLKALGKDAAAPLAVLCKHPGDVLKMTENYMHECGYRPGKAQKKAIVALLDRFSPEQMRDNLVSSEKKASRIKEVIKHLDYGTYSKTRRHQQVFSDLYAGKIMSWEHTARDLVAARDEKAVEFVAQRPGMMVRMASVMLRNGYKADDILEALKPSAASLSMQTLLSNLSKEKSYLDGNATPRVDGEDRNARMLNRENTSADLIKIYEGCIGAKMDTIETGLEGKKVYLDRTASPEHTEVNPAGKTADGGYVPSMVAVKIPDGVRYVRFFVYWNDANRDVDIDLHTAYTTSDGETRTIGYDGEHNADGLVYSGDQRESDSAEYIDIDLETTSVVTLNGIVDYYDGNYDNFSNTETCYVGMMAVSKLGETVTQYNPQNCFFVHTVDTKHRDYTIGGINVHDRELHFIGEGHDRGYKELTHDTHNQSRPAMSLGRYVQMLAEHQHFTIVDSPEEADAILTMCKPETDKDISLIDNNFFCDAPARQTEPEILQTWAAKEQPGVHRTEKTEEIEEIEEEDFIVPGKH